RLLGPLLDVVGDTPAQVVPDGVRGDPRIGPGTAVLVLVSAGLELAPDQDRLTLVHAGAHMMGQPVPAADGEVRGLRVAPLPSCLIEVPGRDADAEVGNRLSGPGGANVRFLGHVADEGHKGALAHVDPPLVPGGPTPPGSLHRAGARPCGAGDALRLWITSPRWFGCGQLFAIRKMMRKDARPPLAGR